MTTSIRSSLLLTTAVLFLAGYSFMNASWSAPTATAPGDNTDAPINVGSTTQAKTGNLMANIVAAATSTWSPEYCDELGDNCWKPGTGNPGDASGDPYISLDFIVAESRGSSVVANQACQAAGYDGLWAFEDRNGSEEIYCYESNIISSSNVQSFVTPYQALRLDPAFLAYWGSPMPTNNGRCSTSSLYRCGYGWYALGSFSVTNDNHAQRRKQTYDKICAFMMKSGKWKEGTNVPVYDSGSDNDNTAVYWNGGASVTMRHDTNNRDDVLELTCVGDGITAQGEWWLKSNRNESYGRGGIGYPIPPMR